MVLGELGDTVQNGKSRPHEIHKSPEILAIFPVCREPARFEFIDGAHDKA